MEKAHKTKVFLQTDIHMNVGSEEIENRAMKALLTGHFKEINAL